MKNTKKVTALVLAVLLTLSLSSVAFATGAPPEYGIGAGVPGGETPDGSTTVGIVATTMDVTALKTSVTVPLYVTLAVTGEGNGKVYAPAAANYAITNNATKGTVGVTGLTIANAAGGGTQWTLTNSKPTGNPTGMMLTLNEIPLTTGNNTATILGTASKGLASGVMNVPAPIIANGGKKTMALAGTVMDNWATSATDMKATAQWKLTYTISPTDNQGNPIQVYTYAGNTKNYVWDAATGAFQTQGAFAP